MPLKAFINAHIMTMYKEDLREGVLLVEGKKIRALGNKLEIPGGIEVMDVQGMTLLPGFIDAHTHLGICEEGFGWEGQDTNEMTEPITPSLRALDAINHEDEGFNDARRAGITTVMVAPGSANVIGGECCVLKTKRAPVDEMLLKEKVGMKAAFGENPKRVYMEKKKMPSTRMATAALLREYLVKARTYNEKRELGGDKAPDRDLGLEALSQVLKGEMPLKTHAHRADDILTIIRVAKEFAIDVTLEHCTEGYKIGQEIYESTFPAIVGPMLSSRVKVELRDQSLKTPGILSRAGVKVALMTDHPVIPIYSLPLCAALAVKGGMDEREALKALTIYPAEILGIADQVGSLEVGKDADFILVSGDPLDLRSTVQKVFIEGQEVYSHQ